MPWVAGLLLLSSLLGPTAQAAQETPTAPGLYFNAAELVALRQKLTQAPFRERFDRLRKVAEQFLDAPLPSVVEPQRYHPRDSLGISLNCSFVYAITGDRRFAERARQEVEALFERDTWATAGDFNKGVDLSTAECSMAAAICYDWCFDTFTPAERHAYAERAMELGTRIYLESIETHHDWWVNNPVTNWSGVCHGGSGLLALALYDEFPEARKAYAYARWQVPRFLRDVVGADGAGHEGVMYFRYGTEFSLIFATAARHRFPGRDLDRLFAELSDRLLGYWDAAMRGPDEHYANFNNMNGETYHGLYSRNPADEEGGPSATLNALFERFAAERRVALGDRTPAVDPLLLWGADHGGGVFYTRGPSPFWYLWRRDVPPSGPQPALPSAMLFRTAGHTIWQTPDIWLAFNGGWTSNRSHRNFDLGTFIYVYAGERFVVDPGYGKTGTAEHSTVAIGDVDQPSDVRARYLAWTANDDFKYLLSDLSTCYGPDLRKFHRHLLLLDQHIVLIVDDLESNGPAGYDWRLQTGFTPSATGSTVTIPGQHAVLHVVSAAPAGAAVSVGQNSVNFVSIKPSPESSNTTFITVLYPDEPGSLPPEVHVTQDADHAHIAITGSNGQATAEFARDASWRLTQVNGAPVEPAAAPVERTFQRMMAPMPPLR